MNTAHMQVNHTRQCNVFSLQLVRWKTNCNFSCRDAFSCSFS